MTAIILLIGIVLLLAIRVPILVALIAPSLLVILLDPSISFQIAIQQITSGLNSSPLLAIPLFVMAGYAAAKSGVAERLVDFANDLLAPVKGGMGYVTIVTGLGFSWMSGSASADAAGMGSVLSKPLTSRGYKAGFSSGLIGASASIGAIMPPSVAAIIYSVSAGVSIGALFVAGVIPALMIALSLVITVFIFARKNGLSTGSIPRFGPLLRKFVSILPILGAPVVILGGILGGIFTPTESAAVAVSYIIFLGFCYREMNLAKLREIIGSSAITSAQIMIIVAAASLVGWVLSVEGIPGRVAELIAGVTDSPWIFMTLVVLSLIVVGMVMESTAAILLMVPVLLPAALEFGVEPVHLGAVVVFSLTVGLLTPPIGMVLYIMNSVTNIPIGTVMRGSALFLIPLTLVLILITYLPGIVLLLPEILGYL